MRSEDLKGVIAAIATPFDEKGRLDIEALKKLTHYVVDGGVHGIMTTGGTGEFPHLLREEKKLITQTVVEAVQGRIPIIAGTAACSTMEALLLCQDAKEAGAEAVIPLEHPTAVEKISNIFKAALWGAVVKCR